LLSSIKLRNTSFMKPICHARPSHFFFLLILACALAACQAPVTQNAFPPESPGLPGPRHPQTSINTETFSIKAQASAFQCVKIGDEALSPRLIRYVANGGTEDFGDNEVRVSAEAQSTYQNQRLSVRQLTFYVKWLSAGQGTYGQHFRTDSMTFQDQLNFEIPSWEADGEYVFEVSSRVDIQKRTFKRKLTTFDYDDYTDTNSSFSPALKVRVLLSGQSVILQFQDIEPHLHRHDRNRRETLLGSMGFAVNSSQLSLQAEQPSFDPLKGESMSFQVEGICEGQSGKLSLSGAVMSVNGEGTASCSRELPVFNGATSWNGTCQTTTGETGTAVGNWQATLSQDEGGQTVSVNVSSTAEAPTGGDSAGGSSGDSGGNSGGEPGGSPSDIPPSWDPSNEPGWDPSDNPSHDPSSEPTSGPTPTPTSPAPTSPPDDDKEITCQAGFEIKVSPPYKEPYCIPCPAPLKFVPDHENGQLPDATQTRMGCYSENGVLAYEQIHPGSEPGYPISENIRVFSPRNQDSVLDHLPLRVGINESSKLNRFWNLSLVKFYAAADQVDALANGDLPYTSIYSFPSQDEAGNDLNIGVKSLNFTGFETGACLADGHYGIVLDNWNYVPAFPTNTGPKNFGFNLYVPELKDNLLKFWVDNTPPIVQNVQIQETQTQTDPKAYRTTVSFTLKEPIVNGAYSNLEPASVKVFVDSSPLYSIPDVDEASFWLLSQWPQNQLNIQTLDARTAQVSFSLPYRLPGHLIEVEVGDKAANQARYTIYPEGGNF